MAVKTSGYTWSAWSTILNAQAVASGQTANATAVDFDAVAPGVIGCEVAVVAVYSAHAFVSGGVVYVCGEISATPTSEAVADGPWAVELAYGNNVTRNKRFFVDAGKFGSFLATVACPTLTNASITFTVLYRTCQLKTQ
jgi:hypothetical protein